MPYDCRKKCGPRETLHSLELYLSQAYIHKARQSDIINVNGYFAKSGTPAALRSHVLLSPYESKIVHMYRTLEWPIDIGDGH